MDVGTWMSAKDSWVDVVWHCACVWQQYKVIGHRRPSETYYIYYKHANHLKINPISKEWLFARSKEPSNRGLNETVHPLVTQAVNIKYQLNYDLALIRNKKVIQIVSMWFASAYCTSRLGCNWRTPPHSSTKSGQVNRIHTCIHDTRGWSKFHRQYFHQKHSYTMLSPLKAATFVPAMLTHGNMLCMRLTLQGNIPRAIISVIISTSEAGTSGQNPLRTADLTPQTIALTEWASTTDQQRDTHCLLPSSTQDALFSQPCKL